MAKMTLLEIVQDILSDMNDDEVNSVSDTIESLQVAQIVKSVYFELIGNKNWPHLRELTQLEPSGTTSRPTHMKVPELVKEVEWVEYNNIKSSEPTRNRWEKIKYVSPDEFLVITSAYNNTEADVDVITDISGATFHIKNDVNPSCWTSFDDEYVVFNSYDNTLDSTLQNSKSRMSVYMEPSWTMEDGHVPDLPSEAFPALLAEAKSTCFARLKQMSEGKAEQQATRQRNWLSRKAWTAAGGITLPSYARRSKK